MDITTKKKVRQLLKDHGYSGNEILMNVETGSTDTARQWAFECVTDDWDCMCCHCGGCGHEENDAEHNEYASEIDCMGTAEYQFSTLEHVRKDRGGNYISVNNY